MQSTTVARHHPRAVCEHCTLWGAPYVPSSVPDKVQVWGFIAEAPGAEEAKEGMPLADRVGGLTNAGRIFWHCMGQLGLTRDDLYISNVCSCRPPGNRKPTPSEIECCYPRLIAELRQVKPKLVTLLGAVAVQGVLGKRMSIADARLYDHTVPELPGVTLRATYHPAALLHAGGGRFAPDFTFDIEQHHKLWTGETQQSQVDMNMTIVEDDATLERVCKEAEAAGEISIDTETGGLDPTEDVLLCIQFAWGPNVAVVDGAYIHSGVWPVMRINEMLGKVRQCYHNAKFDVQWLREYGMMNAACESHDDTMLMSYALDERQGVHSLKHLAKLHCNAPDYEGVIAQFITKRTDSYADIPTHILYKYGAADTYYTEQIRHILWEQMDKPLRRLYNKILMPAAEALIVVEQNGMMYDVEYAEQLAVMLRDEIATIRDDIRAIAGDNFNPGSPQQVKVFFEAHGIPLGNTTNKEALKALEDQHPIASLILAYRDKTKSLSTYVEGWRRCVRGDGRVHSTFMLHGTQTGRLSSRQPNQQNMDRDPKIRNIIRAAPGHQLVEIDASQHELRVMAYLAQDSWLKQVFRDGRDIHGEVATQIFGPSWTKEERVYAKTIVFGLAYGREEFSLAKGLHVSVSEAAQWRQRFLAQIPSVVQWTEQVHRHVLEGKYLETVFGRRRRFGLITAESVHHVLKEAQNFPVQSTAHDMVLSALIEVVLGMHIDIDVAKPVNEIHDAILFEIPEDQVDEQVPLLLQVIEDTLNSCLPVKADFPFKAEVKIGPSWGNMHEVHQ